VHDVPRKERRNASLFYANFSGNLHFAVPLSPLTPAGILLSLVYSSTLCV